MVYQVAFDDQRIAETYDKKLADQAEVSMDLGLRVRRTLAENPNPKFFAKLKTLDLVQVEADVPAVDDDDPLPF